MGMKNKKLDKDMLKIEPIEVSEADFKLNLLQLINRYQIKVEEYTQQFYAVNQLTELGFKLKFYYDGTSYYYQIQDKNKIGFIQGEDKYEK